MVQIDKQDKNQLVFRKVVDANDSAWQTSYKWFFRYATPNLFIWGPLAPAHDALLARGSLAVIQGFLGGLVFLGTFRKHPVGVGKFRRFFNRAGCALSGSLLMVTSFKELSYYTAPDQNPLYVEIRAARAMSQLKGQGQGSYWYGPNNFMPMTNDQYWKMLFSMEVFDIMVDQYDDSTLMKKYKDVLDKRYKEEGDITNAIKKIVKDEVKVGKVHPNLTGVSPFGPYKGLPDDMDTKQVMQVWIKNNPIDLLILEEFKDLLDYEFPRMTTSSKDK